MHSPPSFSSLSLVRFGNINKISMLMHEFWIGDWFEFPSSRAINPKTITSFFENIIPLLMPYQKKTMKIIIDK